MARTFDVSDPEQYQDYLRESARQMMLYGGIHMTFDLGRSITIYDAGEVEPEARGSQLGFRLAMDDGRVLPFPAPAVAG